MADRAATEGQLRQAINDIKGATNGGFGLADEKGGTVKKDLGDTVTVKAMGRISKPRSTVMRWKYP